MIDFADSLASQAERLGAARGVAFAVTLRGEARLLAGDLDGADRDLRDGAVLHRSIGASAGESLALQCRAEVSLRRGSPSSAMALLDDALGAARESYLGHHLLDRIYGARVTATTDPLLSLALVDEAEEIVRGPAETCPACRITLVVPTAIASAAAGDLARGERYVEMAETLAQVILRLAGGGGRGEGPSGQCGGRRHDRPAQVRRGGGAISPVRPTIGRRSMRVPARAGGHRRRASTGAVRNVPGTPPGLAALTRPGGWW